MVSDVLYMEFGSLSVPHTLVAVPTNSTFLPPNITFSCAVTRVDTLPTDIDIEFVVSVVLVYQFNVLSNLLSHYPCLTKENNFDHLKQIEIQVWWGFFYEKNVNINCRKVLFA